MLKSCNNNKSKTYESTKKLNHKILKTNIALYKHKC